MGKGSGGGGSGFIGYRYRLTMQLAVCHGPVDAIRSVWFGDKIAWEGDLRRVGDKGRRFAIHSPGLFGGEDSEGGVSGNVEAGYGGSDQVLLGVNDDGTSDLEAFAEAAAESPAPAWAPERATHYRGVAVLTFLQFYIGMNPYLKDISVEVERYWRGWLSDYAKIGDDMNPAHIIYESITNREWGLGYDPSTIDQEAMQAAAVQLFNENLGLSALWTEQQALEDFIENIKDHIDATFYLNAATGLWTLRLIREGDPVVLNITPDNAQMSSFKRKALGETVNELNVKWVLPETEEFVSVTLQDQASIEAQGQVVTGTREYDAVRNEALAVRLGQRDLRVAAATLAEATIRGNRELGLLNPGDVVNLTWPDYGIGLLRCRVTETRHPSSDGSGIRVDLVEDVFGQIGNVFAGSNDVGGRGSRRPAEDFDSVVLWEVPYWFAHRRINGSLDSYSTYGAVLPVTSNGNVRSATLYTTQVKPSGVVYEDRASGQPTVSVPLADPLTKQVTSTVRLDVSSATAGGDAGLDPFIVIGTGVDAEIARINGRFSRSKSSFTVDRGLLDTHPRVWPAGTSVFIIGQDAFLADTVSRSMGEGVGYRVTMQTSADATQPDDVSELFSGLNGRQGRPLPPQNIRIGGELWPDDVSAEDTLLIEWSTRNRTLQDSDVHVPWDGDNIVREAGTSYTVELVRQGQTLQSVSSTGTSVELDVSNLSAGALSVEVYSERGGLENYQNFSHTFTLQKADPLPEYEPVIVSNPGGWPLPPGGSLVKVPLYTRTADPLSEVSSSGVFTPTVSGRYRVEGRLEPVAAGEGAYTTGATFTLGFGTTAAGDSQSVSAVAPAGGFTLDFDNEYDLTAGAGYVLLARQGGAANVKMTSAGMTITRVS